MSYRECNQMDVGRIVEVRDGEGDVWKQHKLVAFLYDRAYPYIVEMSDNASVLIGFQSARTFCRPVDEGDEGKVGLILGGVEYPGARLIKVITDPEDGQKYAVYKIVTMSVRPVESVSLL